MRRYREPRTAIRARAVKPRAICSTRSGCATSRQRSRIAAITTTRWRKPCAYRPDNFNGRSLTAVTIAAHEVGHALQDAHAFAPLQLANAPRAVGRTDRESRRRHADAGAARGALTRSPRLGLIGLRAAS